MPFSTGPVQSPVYTSTTTHATTPHTQMRRGLSDVPSSMEPSVSDQGEIKIDFKAYAYRLGNFLKNFVKQLLVKFNEILESTGIKACLGRIKDRFEKRVIRDDRGAEASGSGGASPADTAGEAINGGAGAVPTNR